MSLPSLPSLPATHPGKVVAQVYGYLVCFVTACLVIVGIHNAINRSFDRTEVALSREASYRTFDDYRVDYYRNRLDRLQRLAEGTEKTATEQAPSLPMPADSQMQRMYADDQKLAIEQSRLSVNRDILSDLELVIVSALIFWLHWRWLQRLGRSGSEIPGLIT